MEVKNLNVTFRTEEEIVRAVRGVSFEVQAGSTHCIVGESGSGKSVTCHAVLGLTPKNGAVAVDAIRFKGRDLTGLKEGAFEKVRGRPDRHGLPGPHVIAQPGAHHRLAALREPGPTQRHEPDGGGRGGGAALGDGGDTRTGPAG